jgi:hypothetical protein
LSDTLLAGFGVELRLIATRTQLFARRLYTAEYPALGLSQTQVYPPD